VDETAKTIVKAVDAKKDTLYVPFQWAPIMWVIRHVPERIFKKLNL
jgi:decaprenylphospho-beta-D-erythro-pentofuranosid-2-ulose 2-reductase